MEMNKTLVRLNEMETLEITEKDGFTGLLILGQEYTYDNCTGIPVLYEEVVEDSDAAKRIALLKERHSIYKRCTNCVFCVDHLGVSEDHFIQGYPASALPKCFKVMCDEGDTVFCENCISEVEYDY